MTVSPTSPLRTSLPTWAGEVTSWPLTVRIWSPAFTTPSAGDPPATTVTTMASSVGIPSSFMAAAIESDCDSANSWSLRSVISSPVTSGP